MNDLPAWTKDSVLLKIADFARVETLSPEWALDGATGKGVRVAVIDSGVEADHPQLDDCVDRHSGADFSVDHEGSVVITDGPHDDVYGHGTACAGIIHALAPEATITSVRVLGPGLRGKAAAFHAGLQWAVENEFDVINLSLGASKRDWALAFHEVCDRGYFGNSFIVTAANNTRRVSFPSLFSAVASVACNTSDDPLRFHYNPDPPTEFLARGIDIEVPWINGGTTVTTGNSFAAPHIAGFAALIRSKHPDLRPFLVKAALWACAANIRDKQAPIEAAERKMQHNMVGRGTMTSMVLPAAGLVEESFAVKDPLDSPTQLQRTQMGDATAVSGPPVQPMQPKEIHPLVGHGAPAPTPERLTAIEIPAISSAMGRVQALLGSVELTHLIASGDWGNVYAGNLGATPVAVRVVDQARIADPVLLQRFVASIRAAAALDATHVLPIYDLIERDKQLCIVMPRCPSNLAEQQAPMDIGDSCVAALSLLAGLKTAHDAGVLHGDLNRQNALIDSQQRVVISDVGMAAPLQRTQQTARFTPATWARMAPEQIQGEALGTYTDTYAVGSLLFELLSGRHLYPKATSLAEVFRGIAEGRNPAELVDVQPLVHAGIGAVVDKALATNPVHRFATAVSFFEALAGASFTALGTNYIERSRFVLDLK